jgi:RNA polymerase sigma-70 factor (ECF subfamily)
MGELGVEDRTLIRTAFYQGSSYSELASRAAMPLGTVKSRIRRALMKLKGCLSS